MNVSRSVYSYKSQRTSDEPLENQLKKLAIKHPHAGLDLLLVKLRKLGFKDNRKRVYRIYKALSLAFKRKRKVRLPSRSPKALGAGERPGTYLALDFMSDNLTSGRKFRVLNVIDTFTREVLLSKASYSWPASRVVKELEKVFNLYQIKPKQISSDNGPEFIATKYLVFCQNKNIHINYSQPGKPTQNAYIERFNGTMRREVLDYNRFTSIKSAQELIDDWCYEYNYNREHQSLNYLTPNQFNEHFLIMNGTTNG